MSSLITAVFKATIGLLTKSLSSRIKVDDVTNESSRRLIVRKIEEMKRTRVGIAGKDLLTSISYFKEGIELLYRVLETDRLQTEQGPVESASAEGFSLAKGMRKLELSDLDEVLKAAKERFKEARREATKAFANESLDLYDRLLATTYRVMATILEVVDDPKYAIGTCNVCIEELHGLLEVRSSFRIECEKFSIRYLAAWFGKDDRQKIIANVCLVNRVVHDVMKMISNQKDFVLLPCVDIGQEKLDPLRDSRVARLLKKQGMEHACIRWWFGQEGFDEHRLQTPCGIASNSDGHILVADRNALCVFDSSGNFHQCVRPQEETTSVIIDVASSEVDDNIYVLVGKRGFPRDECAVLVLNKATDLPQHKFSVRRATWYDCLHSTFINVIT